MIITEISNWPDWLMAMVLAVVPLFWAYCDLNCGGCRRHCYHGFQPTPKSSPIPSSLKGFKEVDRLAEIMETNRRLRKSAVTDSDQPKWPRPAGISTQGFKAIDLLTQTITRQNHNPILQSEVKNELV